MDVDCGTRTVDHYVYVQYAIFPHKSSTYAIFDSTYTIFHLHEFSPSPIMRVTQLIKADICTYLGIYFLPYIAVCCCFYFEL